MIHKSGSMVKEPSDSGLPVLSREDSIVSKKLAPLTKEERLLISQNKALADRSFQRAFSPFDPTLARLSNYDPRTGHQRLSKMRRMFAKAALQDVVCDGEESSKETSNADMEVEKFMQRKAFLATSMNSSQMMALGLEIPRAQSAPLFPVAASPIGSTTSSLILKPPSSKEEAALAFMRDRIVSLRDEQNRLSALALSKEKQLAELQEQYEHLASTVASSSTVHPEYQSEVSRLTMRLQVASEQLKGAQSHNEALKKVHLHLKKLKSAMERRIKTLSKQKDAIVEKLLEMYLLTQEIEQGSWEAEDHLEELKLQYKEEAKKRSEMVTARRNIWNSLVNTTYESQPEAEEVFEVAEEDDGEDETELALREHDKSVIARAPIREQLQWDRQQQNRIVAGMERIETLLGLTDIDEIIKKFQSNQERKETLSRLGKELSERITAEEKQLVTLNYEFDDVKCTLADLAEKHVPPEMKAQKRQAEKRLNSAMEVNDKTLLIIGQIRAWTKGFGRLMDVPITAPLESNEWATHILTTSEYRLAQILSVLPTSLSSSVMLQPPATPQKFDVTTARVVPDLSILEAREERKDDGSDEEEEEEGTGVGNKEEEGLWRRDGTRILPESKKIFAENEIRKRRRKRKDEEEDAGSVQSSTSIRGGLAQTQKAKERNVLRSVPRSAQKESHRVCDCCIGGNHWEASAYELRAA